MCFLFFYDSLKYSLQIHLTMNCTLQYINLLTVFYTTTVIAYINTIIFTEFAPLLHVCVMVYAVVSKYYSYEHQQIRKSNSKDNLHTTHTQILRYFTY